MSDSDVYIVGIGATSVGKHQQSSFTDLAREAIAASFDDAGGLELAERVGHVWFSNYMMDAWGQRAGRGQAALLPLVDEGLVASGAPIVNLECACASASAAFLAACDFVQSHPEQIGLAVGVEKLTRGDLPREEALAWFTEGMAAAAGVLDPPYFWAPYQALAADLGIEFEVGADRSFAMDIYALWAASHAREFGTTQEQIAAVAAKNHTNAVDNPRAQYRFPMTVEEVLADRVISGPLTRAMCSPGGDAGAAVLVCSGELLRTLPAEIRDRSVRILSSALVGGIRDASWLDGRRAPERAAKLAYERAGLGPEDIDVVELHDACAFAEVHLVEDLGFCERGDGGTFSASGLTTRDGPIPVNPSGGLISRGHPVGATGILMLNEVAMQLRGEAGDGQVQGARIGMVENGGGFAGHDVAVCSVALLSLD